MIGSRRFRKSPPELRPFDGGVFIIFPYNIEEDTFHNYLDSGSAGSQVIQADFERSSRSSITSKVWIGSLGYFL